MLPEKTFNDKKTMEGLDMNFLVQKHKENALQKTDKLSHSL